MQPSLAWQPSLFDGGPPMADVSFDAVRRDRLDATSWIDHAPGWLAGSDELFAMLLRSGRWSQREVRMYDRLLPEPRLTAGWSREVDAAGVPEPLVAMSDALSDRYGIALDRIWVNLYRDGRDSVAWHGDRNAAVHRNPLVATVSLGARRRFVLRRRGGRIERTLWLGHGDLLVMGGACQHDWEHSVPKTAGPRGGRVGPRMSVTLRHSAGEPLDGGRYGGQPTARKVRW